MRIPREAGQHKQSALAHSCTATSDAQAPTLTAREARILHFRRRVWERHGIRMRMDVIEKLTKYLLGRNPSAKLTCRLGVYKLDTPFGKIAVIFDRKHNCPVTTLPDGCKVRGTSASYQWEGGELRSIKHTRKRGR